LKVLIVFVVNQNRLELWYELWCVILSATKTQVLPISTDPDLQPQLQKPVQKT